MTAVKEFYYCHKYKIVLLALLVASSVISLALEWVQFRIGDGKYYHFLPWNLFLAWIPFIAAVVAYFASLKRITFYLVMPICVLVWLIFFPNAPYLLTDFQHLAGSRSVVPLWFNVLLLLWFAWTGLLLGITSLYLMQEIVTRASNRVIGWLFAIGMTVLSSVGVFMGRFLRLNSWNLLQDPLPIAKDLGSLIRDPLANLSNYVFLILFTLLFLFIYMAVHLFGDVKKEIEKG